MDRDEALEHGDLVGRRAAAVVGAGLHDRIADRRGVGVGQHMVVRQHHQAVDAHAAAPAHQAALGAGGDAQMADADAPGRRPQPHAVLAGVDDAGADGLDRHLVGREGLQARGRGQPGAGFGRCLGLDGVDLEHRVTRQRAGAAAVADADADADDVGIERVLALDAAGVAGQAAQQLLDGLLGGQQAFVDAAEKGRGLGLDGLARGRELLVGGLVDGVAAAAASRRGGRGWVLEVLAGL